MINDRKDCFLEQTRAKARRMNPCNETGENFSEDDRSFRGTRNPYFENRPRRVPKHGAPRGSSENHSFPSVVDFDVTRPTHKTLSEIVTEAMIPKRVTAVPIALKIVSPLHERSSTGTFYSTTITDM